MAGRILMGVDYGTTFTKVSYVVSQDEGRTVFGGMIHYEGGLDVVVPSRIAYAEENHAMQGLCWGFQVQPGMVACSWTKMGLVENGLLSHYDDDPLQVLGALGILYIPHGKQPQIIVTDFLRCLYQHCMQQLQEICVSPLDRYSIDLTFTIPAAWPNRAIDITRQAAEDAGFGQRAQDRVLSLITEPEAAFLWALRYRDDLESGDGILICDCGGGTVDIASYEIIQTQPTPSVRPMGSGESAKCGGTAVDSRFYQLMTDRFGDAFRALPSEMIGLGSPFMDEFERVKRRFSPRQRGPFRLDLPMDVNAPGNVYDRERGSVILSSHDMTSLFDPVVEKILLLLLAQFNLANQRYNAGPKRAMHHRSALINKIILIGGWGLSPYLQERLRQFFPVHHPLSIIVPGMGRDGHNAQAIVAIGAAMHAQSQPLHVIQRSIPRHSFPQHYGLESFRAFRPGVDSPEMAVRNEFTAETIMPSVEWVIQQEADYDETYSHIHSISRVYHDGDLLLFPTAVYTYQGAIPQHIDDRTDHLVGYVPVDFGRMDLETFSCQRRNGQKIYHLEYSIQTTVQAPGVLLFTALARGEVLGHWYYPVPDIPG